MQASVDLRSKRKLSLTLAFYLAAAMTFQSACARSVPQYRDIKLTQPLTGNVAAGALSPNASEAAQILNINPLIARLQLGSGGASGSQSKSQLYARILCDWKIFVATQEVRKMVAAIDAELADSNIELQSLMSRRNNTIDMLNTINFAQSGVLGICKQSLSLHQESQASQYPLIISSSDRIGLSTLTLLVPSIYCQKTSSTPNMLADFMDPTREPPDSSKSYVWKFLNAPIPNSPEKTTRRQLLLKHWAAYKALNTENAPLLRRLAENRQDTDAVYEGIKLVGKRVQLLYDLKTHIEEFDTSLSELHSQIRID